MFINEKCLYCSLKIYKRQVYGQLELFLKLILIENNISNIIYCNGKYIISVVVITKVIKNNK